MQATTKCRWTVEPALPNQLNVMEATDEGYKGWWNDFTTLKECKIAFIEELMLERWCWLRESDIDI
jgi:hypothetical protein